MTKQAEADKYSSANYAKMLREAQRLALNHASQLEECRKLFKSAGLNSVSDSNMKFQAAGLRALARDFDSEANRYDPD